MNHWRPQCQPIQPFHQAALHVENDFPEDPFPILDAGPTATGLESTVISLVRRPRLATGQHLWRIRGDSSKITTHILTTG